MAKLISVKINVEVKEILKHSWMKIPEWEDGYQQRKQRNLVL